MTPRFKQKLTWGVGDRMNRRQKQQKVLVVIIVLLLFFIWGNSMMPANISGEISGWAKDVLKAILGSAGISDISGEGVLRKIAHAAEFAALGVLLTLLMEAGRKKIKILLLINLVSILIYLYLLTLFINKVK